MNDAARQIVEGGFDEGEVAREFANEFGIDSEDIEYEIEVTDQSDFGVDYWQVEVSGREYFAFEDDDDARRYAVDYLVQQFEDEPYMLTGVAEWVVQDNVFVSPTDRRMAALDMADYIYELDDEEAVEQAGMEDEYELALEDGDDDRATRIADQAREDLAEREIERWEEGLEQDPIGFLSDEEGLYTKEQLLSGDVNFIQTDLEGVAKAIIQNDGTGPTLSSYDGEERETDGGLIYFRQN